MSDFDIDIAGLLNDVLDEKPIVLPEDQPATPEEVTTVVKATEPDATDDILGNIMNEIADEMVDEQLGVITTAPTPTPDSPEAIEEEVTQCVSNGLSTEDVLKGIIAEGLDGDLTQEEHDEVVAASAKLTDGTSLYPEHSWADGMTPEQYEAGKAERSDGADGATVPEATEVSEHVFSTPTDEGVTVPIPTFTSDEIAENLDIRNFATLVTLNTARWHAKVKDHKAAKDAADASGADAEAFEARKKLLVGADEKLRAVHKAIDAARSEHYRLTLPWSTVGVNDQGKRSGGRLMPNTLFMEYTTAMARCKMDMDTKLTVFEQAYPTLVTIAEHNLGTAFDPSEYPNPSSIRGHFRLSFDFNPIPVGSDFKGLQDAQIQKLGTALESKTRTMLENAMQDAWKQLYESVQHAHSRLSNPDAMFHSTLITKLQDHATMLKHLNATGDARMEEVRKLVEDKLTKHDAKDVRDDDALRKRLSGDAAAIVKRMEEIADA